MATSEHISRRSILNAAAAIAATTAAIPAMAAGQEDAELLHLGAVFDDLLRQYREAEARWRPHQDLVETELAKLNDGRLHSDAEYSAVWARADALFAAAKPDPSEISDLMDKPQRDIMALQPKTLAGLAVKAKVAKFAPEHYWGTRKWKDRDWDQMAATQLIDAVLAMAK
jgi:hypothetical protein